MNLADALSGRAQLEGIQWVLRGAEPHKTLRRELCALLAAPKLLGPCELRHVRFRPGRRLTACHDIHLRADDAGRHSVRPMEVTWRTHGDGDWRHGTPDFNEMQAEAVRRGVSTPFRQLVADVPAWGMYVQVSPLDARFPQLVRVSDPRYVRDMVVGAYAASDVAQDQAPASRYTVTSIRYHPGNRHVLRYDPLDGSERGTLFAKLYKGEDGEWAFRVAAQVAEWLAQHGEGVTSVRPLAYVAEDAVVLYPRILGEPLSQHLQRPGPGVARSLAAVGAALYALHHLPPKLAGPLKLHDFAAEVKLIKRSREHFPALLPPVGGAIDVLLDRAQEVHERLPQEWPTFTYGDFKTDHLWVTSGGLTLIDFDTCRFSDPALDVGKFLADLQFWYATYDQPGLEQAQEQFLAGYGPGAPAERLVRARLYEVIELVKMAGRRVYVFEPDWASRTERLIGRAQAVMNDLQLTLGWPGRPPALQGSLDGCEEGKHLV
jgi:aminoglycoside phosphotransferase (APT) family kinase protein